MVFNTLAEIGSGRSVQLCSCRSLDSRRAYCAVLNGAHRHKAPIPTPRPSPCACAWCRERSNQTRVQLQSDFSTSHNHPYHIRICTLASAFFLSSSSPYPGVSGHQSPATDSNTRPAPVIAAASPLSALASFTSDRVRIASSLDAARTSLRRTRCSTACG